MELKSFEFENVLNTELAGKNVGYSYYNFGSAVLKLIRIFAREAGLNEQDFNYKQSSNNSIYLTYKGTSFADASFKKKKVKYRYGSCEWVFAKCFVNLWNEERGSYFGGMTFQEMLDKIDTDLAAKALAESKKLYQVKEIFQIIKDKLGCDDYGAIQFIELLNKKKYSLTD